MALVSTKTRPMPPPSEPVKLPKVAERMLDYATLPGLGSTVPAVILRYQDSQRWLAELVEGWRREGPKWLHRAPASRLAATAESFRDALAKARGAALMASSVSALRLDYDRLEATWAEAEEAASLLEAAARLKK